MVDKRSDNFREFVRLLRSLNFALILVCSTLIVGLQDYSSEIERAMEDLQAIIGLSRDTFNKDGFWLERLAHESIHDQYREQLHSNWQQSRGFSLAAWEAGDQTYWFSIHISDPVLVTLAGPRIFESISYQTLPSPCDDASPLLPSDECKDWQNLRGLGSMSPLEMSSVSSLSDFAVLWDDLHERVAYALAGQDHRPLVFIDGEPTLGNIHEQIRVLADQELTRLTDFYLQETTNFEFRELPGMPVSGWLVPVWAPNCNEHRISSGRFLSGPVLLEELRQHFPGFILDRFEVSKGFGKSIDAYGIDSARLHFLRASCDMNGSFIEVFVPFRSEVVDVPAQAWLADKAGRKWITGTFNESFPELSKIRDHIGCDNLEDMQDVLEYVSRHVPHQMEVFGITVSSTVIGIFGIAVISAILAAYLLHVLACRRHFRCVIDCEYPWIGFYNDWLSRIAYFLILVAFTNGAALYIFMTTQSNLDESWKYVQYGLIGLVPLLSVSIYYQVSRLCPGDRQIIGPLVERGRNLPKAIYIRISRATRKR